MSDKDAISALENDCLALLSYVSKHRGEPQTYRSLSEATGIPVQTLRRIILWPRIDGKCAEHGRYHNRGVCPHSDHRNHWALEIYGYKYGFGVKFIGIRGRIIDVEFYGHAHAESGLLFVEENASKYPWTEATLSAEPQP